MWEGIDDVITSFSIEYGTLRTAITREIFKILIYFLLQIIIILDGLSFSNVYSKNNFDLTFPLNNYSIERGSISQMKKHLTRLLQRGSKEKFDF